MDAATLLADPSAIHLECFVSAENSITLVVHAVQPQPRCPNCQQPSHSLHSRYVRTVADLPWHGVAIRLALHTRKFRCRNDLCSQKIFCERLPQVVAAYARHTVRLNEALQLLAFALGGEAGARAAHGLSLRISGASLLRRIRRFRLPPPPTPKVLGVDDWAKRKGQHYGTILIDLEQHQPIDLLPDREADTLARWLQAHPGVEIISRDRALAYAEGARRGAPAALQIADRFHLLKNLTEMLDRYWQRRHAWLQAAAKTLPARASATPLEVVPQLSPPPPTKLENWNERRQERFAEVRKLWQMGASIRRIAERLGLHRRTVRLFIHSESCPQRVPPAPRGSQLDRYRPHLEQRWAEGCHNSAEMYRELTAQGYRGSASQLRHFVGRWRSDLPEELKRRRSGPPGLPPRHGRKKKFAATPRQAAWLLLRPPEKLTDEEQNFLNQLLEQSPEVAQMQRLTTEFSLIVKEKKAADFAVWLAQAAGSGITEMKNFASGLQRDEEAVKAALKYEWSNGQTEGQINRLKLLKRQMYGRAKDDLLRARVLHAS